jgi:hypothetical protein
VFCTPHLGASTTEARENVALRVAEQVSDYLLTGAISNAVNFPSITAEEANAGRTSMGESRFARERWKSAGPGGLSPRAKSAE